MVGGGQLARMTHQAAIALGQSLRVLAVSSDDGTALVAADVRIGRHDDLDDLRVFARGCDVVTFDHEHVPQPVFRALESAGHAVWPSSAALRFTQDKLAMRARLSELGVPCPQFYPVASLADAEADRRRRGHPGQLAGPDHAHHRRGDPRRGRHRPASCGQLGHLLLLHYVP